MKKLILGLFIFVLIIACNKESKIEQEIAKIDINFKIERFDEIFANAQPDDLPNLKARYPFFFSSRINDSVWINNMKDTLQEHLFSEVDKTFGNFEEISEGIGSLFQHLKYYDKTFKEPRVITLTNFVDYRNKTIVTDTIVLIALDNYLGAEHEFYADVPRYVAQNLNPTQIVPDLATDYAE